MRSTYEQYAYELLWVSQTYASGLWERACWVSKKMVERFPELAEKRTSIYEWAWQVMYSHAELPFPVV